MSIKQKIPLKVRAISGSGETPVDKQIAVRVSTGIIAKNKDKLERKTAAVGGGSRNSIFAG